MSELPDLQKRCDFSDEGGEKILYAWDDDTAYMVGILAQFATLDLV